MLRRGSVVPVPTRLGEIVSCPAPFEPDQTDLAILNALQDDLPLVFRPWKTIAERLGITESEILRRMKNLEGAGIIRGISPVLESRHLGLHAATLVALRVPEERMDEIAALISSYAEVSHNFGRDHYYSLWFTIAAQDEKGIQRVLDEIVQRTGIPSSDLLDLPTIKRIKINVRFSFLPAQIRETP
jgi:DNA-binding Lrp family transcriptional regulator